MKQFVVLLISMLSLTVSSKAQTYLEHIQQKAPGLGVVTVCQSKAIDDLINGKNIQPQDDKNKATPVAAEHKTKVTTPVTPQKNNKPQEQVKKLIPDSTKKTEHHETVTEKPVTHELPTKKVETEKEENETPMVDMRKKVMRSSYKVTGYRVQAYAGGNSRNDRLTAEQIGNAIKMKYPDQPVYVHFYSPRWICRIGNFRSLSEAQKMLAKIRAMGYRQACLVKGKITVQN